MNLPNVLHDFHFLRPWWLLALPVLLGCALWLARRTRQQRSWSQCIDPQLLPALRLAGSTSRALSPWPVLALAWCLAVLALAGPSWQQDAVAAWRAPGAWMFVLDLSPSMTGTDLAPDRVTRARYALTDLLDAAHDARVGLVAFSDEPYTVTPLTQDAATVKALLPALTPDIMPTPGDHLAPALAQAGSLLAAAGSTNLHVVVLTDGFDDPAAAFSQAAALKARGVSVSVVGVGTAGGAPLRAANGQFDLDRRGQLRLSRLDETALRQLAVVGGGQYANIANLSELISTLQNRLPINDVAISEAGGVQVLHWRDAGIWLLPLLLMSAALLARKDWL